MDIEKRLAVLQNTYAASIAETVSTYDKLGVLENIVDKRRDRQSKTASYINQQLVIESIEDIFSRLSEVYGCANWEVEKKEDGYVASTTSCKLCALSKRMGGANPCYGWCLDPMIAMLSDVSGIDRTNINIESTLMKGDCCRVHINVDKAT